MSTALVEDETATAAGDTDIEAQRAKADFRFTEDVAPGLKIDMNLLAILHSTHSPFQKIDIIETYFGKTLVTDGKTQSAEFDEFAYHESLVHPSLLQSFLLSEDGCGPRSVFIGGGGELATAREVLRHKSVKRLVMVDLDEKVIEVSKKYLPSWGGEAVAKNPCLELIVGDAHSYLLSTKETFDAIIMDISDPIEAGPGIMLYTKEFYEHAQTLLNSPGGVFVTQAGMADSIPPCHALRGEKDTSCFGPIRNTLLTTFDCVVPYSANIPSFGSDWGFIMAFNVNVSGREPDSRKAVQEWCDTPADIIDTLISNRIGLLDGETGDKKGENGSDSLKWYDGTTHRRMFALSKPLRHSLAQDKRVMTKENPIFMF